MLEKIKQLYTTAFDLCYSPCGEYVAAADNYGRITIFRLPDLLTREAKVEEHQAHYSWSISEESVYSLITYEDDIIAGGYQKIQCWSWSSIITKKPQLRWSLDIPGSVDDKVEANSITIDDESRILYAGCGDSKIHSYDLQSGSYLHALSGHTDVVQCIKLSNDNNLTSVSEDGTARIWDVRAGNSQSQHIISPCKEENINRPHIGKWLTALSTSRDLIACGGGPKLSIWSMRTITPLTVLESRHTTHHSTIFIDDLLLSGSNAGKIYHWNLNGELKTKVPVSASTTYSLKLNNNNKQYKVLMTCGSSPTVDVCINYSYSSFTVTL